MLSVVIEVRNHEEALARTLASLVSGAVEGVVREVIVCDAGSTDHSHQVAEQTGCRYLAGAGAAAGIGQARGEWLLLIEPGARLLDGWTDAVLDHIAGAGGPACFRQARQSFVKRLLGRRRPLEEGLVIEKRRAQSLAGTGGSAGAIARAVKARRLDAAILAASG